MSISLYLGCMYASKTSELIREYNKFNSIGKKAICINHSFDNRYGEDDFIYSHDVSKAPCFRYSKLSEIDEQICRDCDVILINEGQFFEDLVEFCVKWCDEHNKTIIVCGLDGTYDRKPFEPIANLIPLANKITKLTAYCNVCAKSGIVKDALFSYRKTDNKEKIVIGTDNIYIPVCRYHYNNINA